MRKSESGMGCVCGAAVMMAVAALVLVLSGCKTVERVETVYRTDTVRVAAREKLVYRTDTVRVTDRVYRGDTIWMRDSVLIKLWRDSVVHDTVEARSRDVEVRRDTVEVVKRSGYDRFCSVAFWVIVVVVILGLTIWVLRRRLVH